MMNRNWATTYSPRHTQVPSALTDLTSLFEMERGDPRRIRHPMKLIYYYRNLNYVLISRKLREISTTWL